ncbi:MAG: type III-B CRISPR module-associated protein Cmr5 [Gemmataceae bacterium]
MKAMPYQKTLDQRRASHAWEAVKKAKAQLTSDKAKQFGGQAKKLPTRIVSSGLGQALAFLKAKDYAPMLLVEIGDWVLDKRTKPLSDKLKPGDDALLGAVVDGTSEFLRRATDETLAYLRWLVRFAEAEGLTKEENGSKKEETNTKS